MIQISLQVLYYIILYYIIDQAPVEVVPIRLPE